MKMLRNLVLVSTKAPKEEEKKSFDPIITKESRDDSGIVVTSGDDVTEIKDAQRVYFLNDYKRVSIKNENYLVMPESNIFAIE